MTTWTSFHLRVLTPLFSGADPTSADLDDAVSLIRVPSIRGVLRYWFRAVAAGHGVTDLTQLAAQESEIFGNTRHPSAITMRINRQPAGSRDRDPAWILGKTRTPLPGITYLLGLGLWKPGNGADAGLLRPFVPPGATTVLDVRFGNSEKANCRFMHAMRAWLLLGGLGARTRRGFGQIELVNISGAHLPGTWEPSHLTRPGNLREWQDTFHTATAITDMDELDDHEWGNTRPADGTLPPLPTLAPPWWGAAIRPGEHQNLQTALNSAGLEWRSFMLTQKPEPRLSTPEWRGAILGEDQRFPRGALGLPVTYHRRADPRTHQAEFNSVVQPDSGQLRRASPVWIRPIRTGNGKWVLMTHLFRCELLPDGTTVSANGDAGSKPLAIPDEQINLAWDAWLSPTGRPQRRLPRNYYNVDGT